MCFIIAFSAMLLANATAHAGPYGQGAYGKGSYGQKHGSPCEITVTFGAGKYGRCPVAKCSDGQVAWEVKGACAKNGGVKVWAKGVKH